MKQVCENKEKICEYTKTILPEYNWWQSCTWYMHMRFGNIEWHICTHRGSWSSSRFLPVWMVFLSLLQSGVRVLVSLNHLETIWICLISYQWHRRDDIFPADFEENWWFVSCHVLDDGVDTICTCRRFMKRYVCIVYDCSQRNMCNLFPNRNWVGGPINLTEYPAQSQTFTNGNKISTDSAGGVVIKELEDVNSSLKKTKTDKNPSCGSRWDLFSELWSWFWNAPQL